MKLGLVSSIPDGWTFEEMVDTVSEMGYQCVEVACWPKGRAERRYAGVSHMDVDALNDAAISNILSHCKGKSVEISALAFYPNVLDGDLSKRTSTVEHLQKVIAGLARLGVNRVTTFIGRDQTKTIEDNVEIVKEVWPPIIEHAQGMPVLQSGSQ